MSKQDKKQATASAYVAYEIEKASLLRVGSYHIILNQQDEAVCIIQITAVDCVPFHHVSQQHAKNEGFETAAQWQNVHQTFFTEELAYV